MKLTFLVFITLITGCSTVDVKVTCKDACEPYEGITTEEGCRCDIWNIEEADPIVKSRNRSMNSKGEQRR